jgi:hypothetical protein
MFELLDQHDGAVTAVATAVLAAFTIVLAQLARRQIRDSRILQRAYLNVEPRGIEPHVVDRGDHVHALIAIRNTGHLPARSVSWTTEIGWPEDHKNPPLGKIEPSTGVLAAGAEIIIPTGPLLSNKVSNYIYVWGMVTYEDGFGVSRFTKFCHRYPSKEFIRIDEDITFDIPASGARYWPHGNDAN